MATPLTGLNSVNASGMIPASGTDRALATSGPWMIEEQEISIHYIRVPSYIVYNDIYSLSAPSRTTKVEWTYIQNRVVAEYTKSYSTDFYSLSSWTQPQTFEYLPASSDGYGNSYGSGIGVSALGPVGTVATKDKWYFRRPWMSSVDFEQAEFCEGTTHYFSRPPTLDSEGDVRYFDALDGMSFFGQFGRLHPLPDAPGTFMKSTDYHQRGDQEYIIFGPYNVSSETPLLMQNYVDNIGRKVEQLDLYGITGGAEIELNPSQPNLAYRNTGCASYSNARHDWT